MKTGCNLAGGDTSWRDWAGSSPVSGTHYLFVTTKDIDYYMSKGCNTFRLLFGWEAMQPTPYDAIPSLIPNHAAYYSKLKALVDYATGKGALVILDIHDGNDADFAAYYGKFVGSSYNNTLVADALVDFWMKMANIFKGNPLVAFGITNEPHDINATVWFSCAQNIISGIRSTGATNLIVMPGTDWTGAGSWTTDGNSTNWNINDSNTAVQVHLYADTDAGGGSTSIVSATILADRMKQVTTWARAKGVKVFVGEVGLAASNSLALSAWTNFVSFCNANSDVIIGFAFWAAGPPSWWGGYQFSLCPTNNYLTDSPQMKLIAPSLTGAAPAPVPAPTPTPTVDPQIAVLQTQLSAANAKLAANTTTFAQIKALLP